jgi:hypothetical protein
MRGRCHIPPRTTLTWLPTLGDSSALSLLSADSIRSFFTRPGAIRKASSQKKDRDFSIVTVAE